MNKFKNYADFEKNYKNDYLFNILEIDNFHKNTSSYRHLYKFVIKNHKKFKGDLAFFGIYRGAKLLSLSILLKKLNSNKKIFAFDNFKGFTKYNKNDDLKLLKYNPDIWNRYLKTIKYRKLIIKQEINRSNISSSNEFNINSLNNLKRKIKFLKLDNINIIKGDFEKTVPKFFKNSKTKFFASSIDSDLYGNYKLILPYIYESSIKNAYINIDEYYSLKYPGCKIAVDEFCKIQNIKIKKNKSYRWEFDRYCLIKK